MSTNILVSQYTCHACYNRVFLKVRSVYAILIVAGIVAVIAGVHNKQYVVKTILP